MVIKDKDSDRDLLLGRETRLLGTLPVEKLQFIVSYTEQIKDDDFFHRERERKRQEWEVSLPEYIPSEEENQVVNESINAVKKGEITRPINPRNVTALNDVLGF